MFIASFPAGAWQTNCYLVGPAPGGECVVVDPGVTAIDTLRRIVRDQGLVPAGVLLTHGHIDHMFSAAAVAEEYGIGCWIHPADRPSLTDPYSIPAARELVARTFGEAPDFTDREPSPLHEVADGDRIELAGLEFEALHAPGHTPGSTMYRLAYPDDDRYDALVLTGDVVFAGSVGRTDLPSGDPTVMAETLRHVVLGLADRTVLLPGHGGQTLVSRERATNPYLQL
ncbi:MBL fold metallo-hydrolase [Raineyella antarctica]|uniref:MBL fold metallo-hydrolase n=1 Tax=Raineyella antarctica TaxID=1577474 RepID=UPI000B833256|nr:MBL fold metallo-hydrolase [Raineyella antarctica]